MNSSIIDLREKFIDIEDQMNKEISYIDALSCLIDIKHGDGVQILFIDIKNRFEEVLKKLKDFRRELLIENRKNRNIWNHPLKIDKI